MLKEAKEKNTIIVHIYMNQNAYHKWKKYYRLYIMNDALYNLYTLKKLWKKVLTKEEEGGIITKLSHEAAEGKSLKEA